MYVFIIFSIVIAIAIFLSCVIGNNEFTSIRLPQKVLGYLKYAVLSTVISLTANCLAMFAAQAVSYDGYLDMVQYKVTISQYSDTIKLYSKESKLDLQARPTLKSGDNEISYSSDLTDLKYQRYQDNIAELIKDLRAAVIKYNEILASRKAKVADNVVNWYIIKKGLDFEHINIDNLLKTSGVSDEKNPRNRASSASAY